MRTNKFANGSFLILLSLSMATSFIVISLLTKAFPLFTAKALYFCQQLISNTLFQIPHSLPNTLLLSLGMALLLGIASFLIQLGRTHLLVQRLLKKRINMPRKVEKIMIPLGLKDKVFLIEDNNLFSFCFGSFSPRIIITAALVSNLDKKELEAVFLHEKAHLQAFDPFKILLGKTFASMFFFLPIFSQLNKNMNATNEILADRFAVSYQQGTLYLRGALRKILSTPQVNLVTVPAISNSDYLEIRITRLVNPEVKHQSRISTLNILTSLSFFVLSWFLLQTPVNAFHMDSDMQPSNESSYYLCSTDNACAQECHHNAQTSTISNPQELFSSSSTQRKGF